MMGRQTGDQSRLFYLFNLEERIPADHLLRRINPVVTRVLAELRAKLETCCAFPSNGLPPSRGVPVIEESIQGGSPPTIA
jgi:hypothetical protein